MARKRSYDDDDGRVIAPMNVDGMPWYMKEHRRKEEQAASGVPDDLTKEETRAIIWGTMKAGLLIASVFILAALVFILFCVFVWF